MGGDNRLVVTAMNVNEQFKYHIAKGLDFSATLGYSTNSAIRDEQYLSIQSGIIIVVTRYIVKIVLVRQRMTVLIQRVPHERIITPLLLS